MLLKLYSLELYQFLLWPTRVHAHFLKSKDDFYHESFSSRYIQNKILKYLHYFPVFPVFDYGKNGSVSSLKLQITTLDIGKCKIKLLMQIVNTSVLKLGLVKHAVKIFLRNKNLCFIFIVLCQRYLCSLKSV